MRIVRSYIPSVCRTGWVCGAIQVLSGMQQRQLSQRKVLPAGPADSWAFSWNWSICECAQSQGSRPCDLATNLFAQGGGRASAGPGNARQKPRGEGVKGCCVKGSIESLRDLQRGPLTVWGVERFHKDTFEHTAFQKFRNICTSINQCGSDKWRLILYTDFKWWFV